MSNVSQAPLWEGKRLAGRTEWVESKTLSETD